MQAFLRREGQDSFAAEKTFMYGRSVSNQVITGLHAWFVVLLTNNKTLENRSLLVCTKKVVPGLVD